MSAFITLHVNLTPEAASALASFVKRASYRDLKDQNDSSDQAEAEAEAFHMVSAAHAINGALVNQGHTQRVK